MSTENIENVGSVAPEPSEGEQVTESGASGGGGSVNPNKTISTTFPSLEAFRTQEPKLYEGMMEGLALSLIGQMRRHNDRMKKLLKEGRQQQF